MLGNMFAKYSGRRWARDFSTSSSSSFSTWKREWDEQSTFGLFLAFGGGLFGWNIIQKSPRQKIIRMVEEHAKYSEEVWDRYYRHQRGEYGEIPKLEPLDYTGHRKKKKN